MNRAVAVARMQLINKWAFLGMPAVIIGGSFLLSLVIFALIPNSAGLSVSRRNFFLGTVGLFTLLSAAISALYVVLGIVETATNRWGLQGRMFALSWVADRSWFVQWFFYFVLMMFLFLLGFWAATVYKRWQATGVRVMSLSFAVLVVAAVALITLQNWWPAVGAWPVTLTPLSLGVLAFAAFTTPRRATP